MRLKVTLTIERRLEIPLDPINNDGAKLIQAVQLATLEDPLAFINNVDAKISVEAVQITTTGEKL